MKKLIASFGVALLAAVLSESAFAYNKSMYPYELPKGKQGAALGCEKAVAGQKLELGKWYTNFEVCKKYADDNGLPMFAVWSNEECIHCWYTDVVFVQQGFLDWQATSPKAKVILCFMAGGADNIDQSGSDAYYWMWKTGGEKLAAFPFTVFWWKKNNVNARQTGDDLCKGSAESALSFTEATIPTRVENVIAAFEKNFKDWSPEPPYSGGYFAYTNTTAACVMQAEASTTKVLVRIERKATAATNQLMRITRDGKTAEDVVLTWAADEQVKNYALADFDTKWHSAGKTVHLTLYETTSASSQVMSETAIDCVSAQANSPANPLWFGERTADTLQFGEWTLDLAAVTNKVRAYNSKKSPTRAYSLILFGGSKWCPDCYKTDENLFGTDKFKAWAKDNNVALGVIDIPPDPQDAASVPSLLDPREGASYFTDPVKSGLGYLTRKMVGLDSPELAKAVADAAYLAGHNTTNGGWNDPARENQNRPGVPIVVLLRDDGTVAGRLTEFANVSPTDQTNIDAHLLRFNELLKQVDMPGEEANDSRQATTDMLPNDGAVTNTLSHTDAADVYRVEPEQSGLRAFYAKNPASAAFVEFRVFHLVGKTEKTDAVVTNKLSAVPGAVLELSKSSQYFVSVRTCDPEVFGVASKVSTVVEYELVSLPGPLTPLEESQNVPVLGKTVILNVEADVTYKLVGLKTYDTEKLSKNGDFYLSSYTGPIEVVFEGEPSTYQIWKTGSVGFWTSSLSVMESHGTLVLYVRRTDGTAGSGTVRISLDDAEALEKAKICSFHPESYTHTWADGNDDTWTLTADIIDNNYRYGDTNIVFRLENAGGDIPVPEKSRVLSVRISELDKFNAGRLALTAIKPLVARSGRVILKENTTAELSVTRLEGTDGEVGCTLSADRGGLAPATKLSWATFNDEPKTVTFTAPAYDAGKATTTVKLTPDKGVKTVSSANKIVFEVVPENAPEFAVSELSVAATRYVGVPKDTEVEVKYEGGSKLSVSKYSGTLPAGVKWALEGKKLVFSGTVTAKAGTYTSVFRVSAGKTKGLTMSVTFTVTDVTVPAMPGVQAINPSVSKTRTYSDITVVNTNTMTIIGLVKVTIPKTGRVSAKYQTATNGTVSLSAAAWDRLITSGDDAGTLVAELAGTKAATRDYRMTLYAYPTGDIGIEVVDPVQDDDDEVIVYIPYRDWSKAHPATDWQGYYTVSMPQIDADNAYAKGAGSMTMKMNTKSAVNAGKFTYAGVYPNGTSFSGTSVLIPLGNEEIDEKGGTALLPVFRTSSTDVLSAMLAVVPQTDDAPLRRVYSLWDRVRSGWVHLEKKSDERSTISELDFIGGIYDSSKSLDDCCEQAFQSKDLTFFSILKDDQHDYLQGVELVTNDFGVTVTDAKITAKKPKALKLNFNRSTGIVSGSYKQKIYGLDGELAERTMTYRGVVMQGWGSSTACPCNPEGDEYPFIAGAAWFTDKTFKPLSIRRGCPFSIGTDPGK